MDDLLKLNQWHKRKGDLEWCVTQKEFAIETKETIQLMFSKSGP